MLAEKFQFLGSYFQIIELHRKSFNTDYRIALEKLQQYECNFLLYGRDVILCFGKKLDQYATSWNHAWSIKK